MGKNKKGFINMKEPIKDLQRFRDFLSSIPLDKYREELKNVKWVEQDLPNELLPLSSIFKYYWEDRKFLNFEDWFENFWEEINTKPASKEVLKNFKKYYFNKDIEENDWFKKGFKARMYRTWISVLTQLDFCYLFEYVCTKENKNLTLECNAELDLKGIDAKVRDIEFQVAKITQRKEARSASRRRTLITIPYSVLNIEKLKELINSPRAKHKTRYQRMLQAFNKYFIHLQNGFVVFHENYLKPIIDSIDDIKRLSEVIEQISLELSGEY
ncbi:MAG: TaqI family restriction endonuclease [Candidatus Omnitrophica bacterium]|nr:TaqI family restriction endonuclease [Candidatus Omnitrophota bacterium]MCM8810976.1 TaqI family restriction endonuclease [Candidatus Omnitrophota bacterium]